MKSNSLIGQTVRAYVGNAVHTVLLIEQDTPDSFVGVAFIPKTIFVNLNPKGNVGESIPGFGLKEGELAYCTLVKGLRQYPYTARPDYVWQFVMVGDDEQPLIDIATRGGMQREQGEGLFEEDSPVKVGPEGAEITPANPTPEPETELSGAEFHEADTNQDKIISKAEKREHEAATGEKVKKGPYTDPEDVKK